MGITKEFSLASYSSMYQLGYERNCNLGMEFCLCPALQDYHYSFHLCKCIMDKAYTERISYCSKGGKIALKTDTTDLQCCTKYEHEAEIVDLYCEANQNGELDQLQEYGAEKVIFAMKVLAWQLTQAIFRNGRKMEFWTVYCAFNPKCLMYDICNIIHAVFECIRNGNAGERWIRILYTRLSSYSEIFNKRSDYKDQYLDFLKIIFSRLNSEKWNGCSYRMYNDKVSRELDKKVECRDLITFLAISPAGKTLYLEALKALFFVTGRYLSEWKNYGFEDNSGIVAQCSELFSKYTAGCMPESIGEKDEYGKFINLESAAKKTAVLNAGKVCSLVETVQRRLQVKQYWTKM